MVAPYQDDYTALMWATQNNHVDVVCTLLSHGADVNVTNDVRMNEAWH
jgi:ankyrin repeat protein